LALEARAFPFITFDPDAGATLADCISLDGNPSIDTDWPEYTLAYVDADGIDQSMQLPLTIADWAATEGRFKKHFKPLKGAATGDEVPFHEFLRLSPDERAEKRPFIYAASPDRRLTRLSVSPEIATLADERQHFWHELRTLAGIDVPESVRDRVTQALEAEFEARMAEMRRDHESKMTQLKAQYPMIVARTLAEGLLKSPGGQRIAHELLASGLSSADLHSIEVRAAPSDPPPTPPPSVSAPTAGVAHESPEGDVPVPAVVPAGSSAAAVLAAEADDLQVDPYIDSVRCTTCNECTNLNSRMFAYNAKKQAFIKDAKAGTFAQLVQAAEKCPVSAIHPGTPVNPREKDLPKWIARAKPFN
jgi:pyruvate-ferredoxin/flavodoxin oxidoreductase